MIQNTQRETTYLMNRMCMVVELIDHNKLAEDVSEERKGGMSREPQRNTFFDYGLPKAHHFKSLIAKSREQDMRSQPQYSSFEAGIVTNLKPLRPRTASWAIASPSSTCHPPMTTTATLIGTQIVSNNFIEKFFDHETILLR